MNQGKRQDTATIVRDIFAEHPDWNARQIYDRYLILIGDTNKAVTLNAIQKHLEKLKEVTETPEYQELESTWNIGTYKNYPIPAESIPYVLAVQKWSIENKEKPLTIRHALWASKLCHTFGKLPLDFKKAQSLWTISGGYAWYEKICDLSNVNMDTTKLDYALMGLVDWKDAIHSLMLPIEIQKRQVSPSTLGWLLNMTKGKNRELKEKAEEAIKEIRTAYFGKEKDGEA